MIYYPLFTHIKTNKETHIIIYIETHRNLHIKTHSIIYIEIYISKGPSYQKLIYLLISDLYYQKYIKTHIKTYI